MPSIATTLQGEQHYKSYVNKIDIAFFMEIVHAVTNQELYIY